MRHARCRTALALVAALAACAMAVVARGGDKKAPAPGSPEFPRYVMDTIDDIYRGLSSHGVLEMQVKTRHWTRTISLESWSLRKDYSLVRILSPKKERGTATLKAKHDLFTYLNQTGRTIKITSGMMGASWMGSHFTNDDLVKDSRLADDFRITLAFDGEEAGTGIYRFVLVPKPDAAVVWGKIEVVVRKADLQPLSQVFYDEDGKKVRRLELSQHRIMGGRLMPTVMVMRPLDGSGEYTQVTWKKIDFGAKLDSGFFTLGKLRSF